MGDSEGPVVHCSKIELEKARSAAKRRPTNGWRSDASSSSGPRSASPSWMQSGLQRWGTRRGQSTFVTVGSRVGGSPEVSEPVQEVVPPPGWAVEFQRLRIGAIARRLQSSSRWSFLPKVPPSLPIFCRVSSGTKSLKQHKSDTFDTTVADSPDESGQSHNLGTHDEDEWSDPS